MSPGEPAHGPARGLVAKTGVTLEMIKVAHTVFALPFALASLLLAAGGWPGTRLFLLVVLALVTARAAAMAFNRLVDADYDARNPRTRARALPAGRLTRAFVGGFVVAACLLFVAVSWQINRLCLWLSPVALAVTLGYSFAKRFTTLCHVWLGVALGISPLAAWIAVTGRVDASTWIPGMFAGAVLFWVAGFDLIYACQDVEFDRREGLFSLPARLGPRRALVVARLFHLLTLLFLVEAGRRASLGASYFAAVALVALLLGVQHWIADPADPKRLEIAFFRANALIGPIVLVAVACSVFRR